MNEELRAYLAKKWEAEKHQPPLPMDHNTAAIVAHMETLDGEERHKFQCDVTCMMQRMHTAFLAWGK